MSFDRFAHTQSSRSPRTGSPSTLRIEVCPPSLRQVPLSRWHRLLYWLTAPAPQDAAPALNRLPAVRADFVRCLSDVGAPLADELQRRIGLARTLRELWHLRAEVYRVVALGHSQHEADRRLAGLNHHFPTRAPRSNFAALTP